MSSKLQRAERVLERGRLSAALELLDSVPPADPEYSGARALATAVERRLRTAQDRVAAGLLLRAQWRDEEALEKFQSALAVWSGHPDAAALIRATEARREHIRPTARPNSRAGTGGVAVTVPVDVAVDGSQPGVAGARSDDSELSRVAPGPAPRRAYAEFPEFEIESVAAARNAPTTDPREAASPDPAAVPADQSPLRSTPGVPAGDVEFGLAAASAALRRRDFDDAIAMLAELRSRAPESREVVEFYVAVLHQRALLLYGQGEVSTAISLWERVLAVDTRHHAAADFAGAARAELGMTVKPSAPR